METDVRFCQSCDANSSGTSHVTPGRDRHCYTGAIFTTLYIQFVTQHSRKKGLKMCYSNMKYKQ